MRVSRVEMDRNHERIVAGAARLFRERGVDDTSVADVMDAAGLTHGGFYRHFETKGALVSAAIKSAFAQMKNLIATQLRNKEPAAALAAYRTFYLSKAHLSRPGAACPVATLAGELTRASPDLKCEFGYGVKQIVGVLADYHQALGEKQAQTEAMREFAQLVGAAVIARACDPDTAQDLLEACR